MGLLDERFDSSIDGPLHIVVARCGSAADVAAVESALAQVLSGHEHAAPVMIVRRDGHTVTGLWRTLGPRPARLAAPVGMVLGGAAALALGPAAAAINAVFGGALAYFLVRSALVRQLAAPLLLPVLRTTARRLTADSACIIACIERELSSLAIATLTTQLGSDHIHRLAVRDQHTIPTLVR